MKYPLCSQNPNPLHYFSNPSPRNSKIFILPQKTLQHPNFHTPTTQKWKTNANTKGFGTVKDKNTPTKRNSKKNTNGNSNGGDDDHLPEVVLERIIVRILVSVGVPLASGLAALHFLGMVKEQHLWDVPLWVPLVTTFVTFGMSALGIAYGPISTSWDAEKKGSLLGFEEAKKNWVEMWKEENDMY